MRISFKSCRKSFRRLWKPFKPYLIYVVLAAVALAILLLICRILAFFFTIWGALIIQLFVALLGFRWVLRAMTFPGSLVCWKRSVENVFSQHIAQSLGRDMITLRTFLFILLKDAGHRKMGDDIGHPQGDSVALQTLVCGPIATADDKLCNSGNPSGDLINTTPVSWASDKFTPVDALRHPSLVFKALANLRRAAKIASIQRSPSPANVKLFQTIRDSLGTLSAVSVLVESSVALHQRGPEARCARLPLGVKRSSLADAFLNCGKSDSTAAQNLGSWVCSLGELLNPHHHRKFISSLVSVKLVPNAHFGDPQGAERKALPSSCGASTPFVPSLDSTTHAEASVSLDSLSENALSHVPPVTNSAGAAPEVIFSEAVTQCTSAIQLLNCGLTSLIPLAYPRTCTFRTCFSSARAYLSEKTVGSLDHLRADLVFRTGGMITTVPTEDGQSLDGIFLPANPSAFKAVVAESLKLSARTLIPTEGDATVGDATAEDLEMGEGRSGKRVRDPRRQPADFDFHRMDMAHLGAADLSSLGPVVVYCNTNAEYYETTHPNEEWLGFYRSRGVNLFLFNYRGYGRSTGVVSPSLLGPDGVAVVKFLQAKGVRRLGVHGRSIGGSCAIHIAATFGDAFSWLCADRTFAALSNAASSLVGPWTKPIMDIASYEAENVSKYLASTAYKLLCCDSNDVVVYDIASLKTGVAMALAGSPIHSTPGGSTLKRLCPRFGRPRTTRGLHVRRASKINPYLPLSAPSPQHSPSFPPPEPSDVPTTPPHVPSRSPFLHPVGDPNRSPSELEPVATSSTRHQHLSSASTTIHTHSASARDLVASSRDRRDSRNSITTGPSPQDCSLSHTANYTHEEGMSPRCSVEHHAADGILVLDDKSIGEVVEAWTFLSLLIEMSESDKDHPQMPIFSALLPRVTQHNFNALHHSINSSSADNAASDSDTGGGDTGSDNTSGNNTGGTNTLSDDMTSSTPPLTTAQTAESSPSSPISSRRPSIGRSTEQEEPCVPPTNTTANSSSRTSRNNSRKARERPIREWKRPTTAASKAALDGNVLKEATKPYMRKLQQVVASLGLGINTAGQTFADSLSATTSLKQRKLSLLAFLANLQVWGSIPADHRTSFSLSSLVSSPNNTTSSVPTTLGPSFAKFATDCQTSVEDLLQKAATNGAARSREKQQPQDTQFNDCISSDQLGQWMRRAARECIFVCRHKFAKSHNEFRTIATRLLSPYMSEKENCRSTVGGSKISSRSNRRRPGGQQQTGSSSSLSDGSSLSSINNCTATATASDGSSTSSYVVGSSVADDQISADGKCPPQQPTSGEVDTPMQNARGVAASVHPLLPSVLFCDILEAVLAALHTLEDFVATISSHFRAVDLCAADGSIGTVEEATDIAAALSHIRPVLDHRQIGHLLPVDCGHNGGLNDAELKIVDFHLRHSGLLVS